MPGLGNFRIPTLSIMPEIDRFCNPTTAASTAIVCNNLLWRVILELLENMKFKAFEEGKKSGRKELENKKNTEERAYDNGWREGHEAGLEEGKEERCEVRDCIYRREGIRLRKGKDKWVSNHGEGLCTSPEVSMP